MATAPQITTSTILRLLAIVLIVTVSFVGVIVPLLTVLWRGVVWPDETTRIYLLTVVRATLWQATLSTLLVVVIAVPTAWAIVRSPGVLASVLTVIIGVPFVMPAPVVATMFALVCARDSWCATGLGLTVPQGIALVVLVHAWYNTGVLVRIVVEAWYAIQGRYIAAAAALGASPWRYLMTVEWPLLRPACIAGTTLVFLYCVGSFGVVLLLGGGRVPSLEVETWRQTSQLLRLDVAAGLSVVQLLMSGGLLILANRFRPLHQLDVQSVSHVPAQTIQVRVLATILQSVVLLLVVVPFGVLIWRLRDVSDWSVIWHLLNQPVRGSGLFVSPFIATLRSIFIATSVACVTLMLAWIASQLHPILRIVTMLPIGISAVTLGLGYMLLFGRWGMLTAWWLVILAHVVIALPLVMRQIMLARQQLAQHYVWAAAVLGAAPLRQWYSVEIPLVRRALVAAGLFGFAVSLGDFAASLLLTRPDAVTAPVYIARLLGKPGVQNFQLAQLLSLILACCCVLVIIGAEILLHVRRQSPQKR